MTSSFQVRICILSREVETSFEFKWTRRKSVNLTILGQFVNKPLIKLLLAYSFQKMFFIGQNPKHVHMTYLELFLNFWSSFV